MTKLEELLKETDFTNEERKIYEKVKLNYALQDLQEELNGQLEHGDITEKEYNEACEYALAIIDKYDDYMSDYSDWNTLLCEAIKWSLED